MSHWTVHALLVLMAGLSAQVPPSQQRANTPLQLGTSINQTIGKGQVQRYPVTLEPEQFLQVVVDQHGIDLIIRTFTADRKILGEFDSPNGTDGPEVAQLVAAAAGVYSVEVSPLTPNEEVSGRYELRVTDLRRATETELRVGKSREALKAKGIALLSSALEMLQNVRSVQTRVTTDMQAAQLLWPNDEKLAKRMAGDAMTTLLDYIEKLRNPPADVDINQMYSTAQQLRQSMLNALAQFDAESALTLLRATRSLPNPDFNPNNGQADPEVRMEIQVASQIAGKDPKRAALIAEEAIARGYSANIANVISGIRNSEPVLAARLMGQSVAKLQNEKLLNTPDAATTAVNLLRLASSPAPRVAPNGVAPLADVPLLGQLEYRNLFSKVLDEALAFTPDATASYSAEMNAARNTLNALKSMNDELRRVAPASVKAVEDKVNQLNTPVNPRDRLYQDAQNPNTSVEASLASAALAPPDIRDNLYGQIAQKVANAGDLTRARQIANDFILNLRQRQQTLDNIERQAIQGFLNKGRIEEAMRLLPLIRQQDRTNMIGQIVNTLNNSAVKKDRAAGFLSQLRAMIATSPRAENQSQMSAMLQIAGALARFEPVRGFEIVEPLIEQFNEMTAAAVFLNGFGQEYYRDGEMTTQSYTPLNQFANELNQALGKLAVADFDRARNDVDRIRRPEIRIAAYLAMAQQTINPPPLGR